MKIEDKWKQEKDARHASATVAGDHQRGAGKSKLVRGFVGLALVAVLVVGAVFGLKALSKSKSEPEVPHHEKVLPGGGGTVSIEIRAKPPMAIRIDGNRAGTTPITLHVPKHGQLLMIEATARGKDPQFKQVTADHDQTVDFQ